MGKKCSFLCGALTGAFLAGAATLLLAPKSGKEIRREVEKIANDFSDPEADKKEMLIKYHEKALKTAKEKAEKVQEKALETKEFMMERAAANKEMLHAKIQPQEDSEVMDSFEDIIINAQETAEKTIEPVIEATQEAHEEGTDNFI
ncbi:MAG: YtxH domain-containing protein [Streptococcaceae bacterium]|jgi:gas vesicle protein|nr:YtxH domain-containing protein [Streptococcaceae bacterium]